MPEPLIAYTLSQGQTGWTWSLWDEDGGVIAAGAAPDQVSAERGVLAALELTRLAPPPERPFAEAPLRHGSCVLRPVRSRRRKPLQSLAARPAQARGVARIET